jgi:hypothetical protein
MRSAEFRARWGAHNVRQPSNGAKLFRHPIAGELTLAYESFGLNSEPGLSLVIYSAQPDSVSADRLQILARDGSQVG